MLIGTSCGYTRAFQEAPTSRSYETIIEHKAQIIYALPPYICFILAIHPVFLKHETGYKWTVGLSRNLMNPFYAKSCIIFNLKQNRTVGAFDVSIRVPPPNPPILPSWQLSLKYHAPIHV